MVDNYKINIDWWSAKLQLILKALLLCLLASQLSRRTSRGNACYAGYMPFERKHFYPACFLAWRLALPKVLSTRNVFPRIILITEGHCYFFRTKGRDYLLGSDYFRPCVTTRTKSTIYINRTQSNLIEWLGSIKLGNRTQSNSYRKCNRACLKHEMAKWWND